MATIKIRRSTTAGAVPSSLVTGEVAINEADGALYYRNSGGSVSRFLAPQQGITYSSQSASALIGRTVLVNSSSVQNITLDADSAIPTGAQIYFIRTGSANVLFYAGSGGTVYAHPSNVLAYRYASAIAVKISSTDWALQVLPAVGPATQYNNVTSTSSVLAYAQSLLSTSASTPTSGGGLTINGVSLGNHDFVVKQGAQTISAFTASDWFTSTADTASAWVIVNGNLTINSGITVIPSVRKLFAVVYVEGSLTLNGDISMSSRGANHSGTGNSGGSTTAGDIRVATGTYSSTTNPTVPAAGGSGGTGANGSVNAGGAATLGSGGGGSGASTSATGGSGAAGTAFCGGPGGGGAYGANGGNGVANGGAGGTAGGGAGAGVGNPTGGCGGTLLVIVNGAVSGSGNLLARGGSDNYTWQVPMSASSACGGGGAGGGVVILMKKSGSGPVLSASGGTVTVTGGVSGGTGGAGATATLTIP